MSYINVEGEFYFCGKTFICCVGFIFICNFHVRVACMSSVIALIPLGNHSVVYMAIGLMVSIYWKAYLVNLGPSNKQQGLGHRLFPFISERRTALSLRFGFATCIGFHS